MRLSLILASVLCLGVPSSTQTYNAPDLQICNPIADDGGIAPPEDAPATGDIA